MEIRDPVQGSIRILDEEKPIIQHKFFQRLRNIKQLGLSELTFPGATHTRFLHSIGVMNIASQAFNKLFKDKLHLKDYQRLKETLKLAGLLHDIGHAPLSHSTETVMPKIRELDLDKRFLSINDIENDRQSTHVDYTIKSITDSSLTTSFKDVESKLGVDKNCIADLIIGATSSPEYFTVDQINYFPLLHQLISSELDCDRMDYLLRDSYFCGVSYGHFDLDWIIDNLEFCVIDGSAYLGITERAVSTFDDFLLSRYHMFLMVYFHYKSVCLEQLLFKFFATSPYEYQIPSNIEEYQYHDDHRLWKVLRNSENPYAKRIVNNNIPNKIFESFNERQLKKLDAIQDYFTNNDIEFIRCSSTNRISKYYLGSEHHEEKFHLKVVRKLHSSTNIIYFNINEATDLFYKFSKSHAVNRLHCDLNTLSTAHRDHISKIINE